MQPAEPAQGPSNDPAGPPPAGPPVVPGYVLEELLGRGGSGEVWRAVPRGGGPEVAVKLLLAGDPERQAREAALLGELDHPHLVRLHEVVHQPRRGGAARVALVLDLLPGGSLAALLARRGRLRPGEVVTALAPVAAALAHAHERGVVHGDLSPGNVVFTAEGRPVLTDLGVARVLGEAAAAEVTPAYVDPTVARGGAPGPASDVFGVGAAAFHALTGVPPWNASGPEQVLAVAAGGQLPDLAELAPAAPDELLTVVRRALDPDPGRRGSAAALALDLRAACRPEPVRLPTAGTDDADLALTGRGPRTELTHQVRRAPAPEGARPDGTRRRWWGSHRVVTALVAVVAVGLVTGGVLAVVHRPGTGPSASARSVAPRAPATRAVTTPAVADPADTTAAPGSAAGWQQVVAALYRRRAQAFATGAGALLGGVYAPGSPLLAADEGQAGALAASGELLRGFAPDVSSVSVESAGGDRAVLRLVDAWAGYDVVRAADPSGAAVARAPARPATAVRMELVRTPAGWRIDTAERAG